MNKREVRDLLKYLNRINPRKINKQAEDNEILYSIMEEPLWIADNKEALEFFKQRAYEYVAYGRSFGGKRGENRMKKLLQKLLAKYKPEVKKALLLDGTLLDTELKKRKLLYDSPLFNACSQKE